MLLPSFVVIALLASGTHGFVTRKSDVSSSNELLKLSLGTWDKSHALANAVVAQMTLDEKLGVIIGTGQLNPKRKWHLKNCWILYLRRNNVGRCVGDTYAIPRLGIPSICFQDGPAGMRLVKNVTGFPTGINAASTFSRRLMRQRGVAIGEEFRGKGAQSVRHNEKFERRINFIVIIQCFLGTCDGYCALLPLIICWF